MCAIRNSRPVCSLDKIGRMKSLVATVDEDFAQIDRLLKELRGRIAVAAEAVHVAAEKVTVARTQRSKRRMKGRSAQVALVDARKAARLPVGGSVGRPAALPR